MYFDVENFTVTISVLVLGVYECASELKVENDDSLHYRSGLARIA